ncbi:MAG: hypothetical protein KF819_18010 [Labilithrix sp.]|nr:hypothetical protein [Labilithrix sp.]
MRRALLLAFSACVAGCFSKATAYDGKFTFAYASGLDVENFVKPIAPGAKLDVVAFANGTEDALTITKVVSSRPGVVSVESVGDRKVTLLGRQPGVADLEITAKDAAGNVLVDRMFFHVAKPAKHGLRHACTENREAAYVRGEHVDVSHGLATSDGRSIVGYAYAPVRVEPAGALELVAQPQGFDVYRFRATKANASVSIRSTVDDGALATRIVEKKDLTEATLDHAERIVEGGMQYAVARVKLGETPVCNQNALTKARSLTPDICKVTANLDDEPGVDSNHEQLALVTGLKFGVCEYEVTLPELGGGGIVLKGKTKVGRLQFPGEGAAPREDPASFDRASWTRGAIWLGASRLVLLVCVLVWLRARLSRASS